MSKNAKREKQLRAQILELEKRRKEKGRELADMRAKIEPLIDKLALIYIGTPEDERGELIPLFAGESERIVARAEELERDLAPGELARRVIEANASQSATPKDETDDGANIELPLTPIEGTKDQFTATLPDGNRIVLTGQMPDDGGDATFKVHAAQEDGSPATPEHHMPGCGIDGPFIEGQHSGCDLCGGTLRFCGHNAAPYGGRCCDTCQQKRVLPRRIAINLLMVKLTQATVTPFAALEARDAVTVELMRPESMEALLPVADVPMMKALTAAEIVAWDSGLERAAVRGAESFEGTPWDVKPCNHLLLLDGCMAVLLLVGESATRAIVLSAGGPRVPVKVLHAEIRRGQLISGAEIDRPRFAPPALPPGQFWHYMAALQRFMELEVVQRESAHLPRQATRAAMRAGQPLPKVIVVRLRRVYQEKGTGESEVEWHHRWMVRGHWRRQWYAKTREHKVIYIAPFIKGPEGAPFLPPRDVVKVVTR